MRGLTRNKRRFYYATLTAEVQHTDEWGNLTSEYDPHYSAPIEAWGNISPARNADNVSMFGMDLNYDKQLVMCPANVPIDEYCVLWVDTMPVLAVDGSTETPFDYVVRRVARSINSVTIALSKVDVRHE